MRYESLPNVTHPPIVLDTSAFSVRGFTKWLRSYRGRKWISPIVYTELAVRIAERQQPLSALDGLLHGLGVEVVRMNVQHARWAAEFAGRFPGTFRERWRDYMIGALAAIPPVYMISVDTDFRFLEDRALTPYEFMDGLTNGTIR